MGRIETNTRVAAVRRGQIIQRILVDDWSPAEAAAFHGVEERQVFQWVAAYRRDGMASLRGDPASEPAPSRWARWVRLMMTRILRLRGGNEHPESAPCVELRRRDDTSARR